MVDGNHLSASECLALLRKGEASSLELVDACIARIEAHDRELNAVVARCFEQARESARASDAARSRGEEPGALEGLPITVKDSLETAGLVTTSGAPELRDHVPRENAVAVERVLRAGAILLGKTNLPLYAGDWQSYNAVYGRTDNPWDRSRTPGGSSGGSAVSIAAGFAPLEIGSDIAGSIRIPASFCGVYGHKPTHGIVPLRGHIPGAPGTRAEPDLGTVGPLARSASDLRLALDVMAGPDDLDAAAWKLTLPPSRAEQLRDFRVGCWLDDPFCPIDPAVRTQLELTVEALRPHAKLVDVSLPFHLEDFVPGYVRLLLGVLSADMPGSLKAMTRLARPYFALAERFGLPSDPVVDNAARGIDLAHADWIRTDEGRARLRWQCQALFEEIDVLLTPVTPVTAFPHRLRGNHLTRRIVVDGTKRPYSDLFSWIALASAAYLPATSAPVGFTPEGLPVNVQIIGPHLEDHTTIRFAELLAEIRGGFLAPPLG